MTNVVKDWVGDWESYAFNGTQALNAAVDDEWVSLGEELSNQSLGRALQCDFHLAMDSAIFVNADSAIELYLVPIGNADVYPDFADDVTTDQQQNNVHFIGSLTTSGGTAAQELYLRDVELPVGKFKLGARNRASVTLAGTNTLYRRFHTVGSA